MDLVGRVVQRSVAARRDVVADEVARIVTAAHTVIRGADTLDVSIRSVITESGLSNQAFYRHFAGKDDLLIVLVADTRTHLASRLRQRMAATTDRSAQAEAWIRGLLRPEATGLGAGGTRMLIASLPRLEARFPHESGRSRDVLVEPLAEIPPGPHARTDATFTFELVLSIIRRTPLDSDAPGDEETDDLVRYALTALGLRNQRSPIRKTSAYRFL